MASSYRLDSESEICLRTRYTPVVPPDVLSRELGIPEAEICKLDANENLYGAHPQVPRARPGGTGPPHPNAPKHLGHSLQAAKKDLSERHPNSMVIPQL